MLKLRQLRTSPVVRLAALLAVFAIVLAVIAPWPSSTTTGHTYQSNPAIAWSFWNNEPSMAYTRNYVASQHENVAYVTSINAPETADMDSLIGPDDNADVAVYDVDARLWHVYRLTED